MATVWVVFSLSYGCVDLALPFKCVYISYTKRHTGKPDQIKGAKQFNSS